MWIRLKEVIIEANILKNKAEEEIILEEIIHKLKIDKDNIIKFCIFRKSPDLRKNNTPLFVYTVDVKINPNNAKIRALKGNKLEIINKKEGLYDAYIENVKKINANKLRISNRPIVVGFGPAGMFAALILTEIGVPPIIFERGENVEARIKSIERFNKDNQLNPESNVQFGEGGAGTFSDGKLNSLIREKDRTGRFVLEAFVKFGAPQEILYKNKPHIGTDILRNVIKNIREYIISKGAKIYFNTKMSGILIDEFKSVKAVNALKVGIHSKEEKHEADAVFMAIGHSARDTFEYLKSQNIAMEKKPFSIGVRIEHLQKNINVAQYKASEQLMTEINGAADYKLSHHASNGRGVYTFCMCPGGYVVNAASEDEMLVTNGMSNFDRAGENANSALLVSVTPEDFPEEDVLAGMTFQRKIERAAYVAGGKNWKAPCQLVGDFLSNKTSACLGEVIPTFPNGYTFSDMNSILPFQINEALKEGIIAFGRKINGFDDYSAVLTGCETRSSSPVRILRDEKGESKSIKGLYPIGEGAGYAGGILSASTDGIKSVEKWLSKM